MKKILALLVLTQLLVGCPLNTHFALHKKVVDTSGIEGYWITSDSGEEEVVSISRGNDNNLIISTLKEQLHGYTSQIGDKNLINIVNGDNSYTYIWYRVLETGIEFEHIFEKDGLHIRSQKELIEYIDTYKSFPDETGTLIKLSQDPTHIVFKNKIDFDELHTIKRRLIHKGVLLNYTDLKADINGNINYLGIHVKTIYGYSGSASGEISTTKGIGFDIDPDKHSQYPFSIGGR